MEEKLYIYRISETFPLEIELMDKRTIVYENSQYYYCKVNGVNGSIYLESHPKTM